jgi:hypothetical protein
LSILADDICRLVFYVMDGLNPTEFCSFSTLKRGILYGGVPKKHDSPLFPKLRNLFDSLDKNPESWWVWALPRREGVR